MLIIIATTTMDQVLVMTISSEISWKGEHAYTAPLQVMATKIGSLDNTDFFILPTFGRLATPNLFSTMLRAREAIERSKEEFDAFQVANIMKETFPKHVMKLVGRYGINKYKNWLQVCENQPFMVLDFIDVKTYFVDELAAKAFVMIFSQRLNPHLLEFRFGLWPPPKGVADNPFGIGNDVLILPHSGAMITLGEYIVKASELNPPRAKCTPEAMRFKFVIKQIFGDYDLLPVIKFDPPIINWTVVNPMPTFPLIGYHNQNNNNNNNQ